MELLCPKIICGAFEIFFLEGGEQNSTGSGLQVGATSARVPDVSRAELSGPKRSGSLGDVTPVFCVAVSAGVK